MSTGEVVFVRTGNLDLAIPTISPSEWCHAECYERWSRLSRATQGILGGHIHFSDGSWSVPFAVPMEVVGSLSPAGVINASNVNASVRI